MADVGDLWTKQNITLAGVPAVGWTKLTTPYIQGAAGNVKVQKIYQKTGTSTWTIRYSRDTVPPGPPQSVTGAIINTDVLQITAKAPSDADQQALIFRWSTTAYPTSPTGGGGSGWVTAGPNVTVATTYPSQKSGTVYYWAVFARDVSGNVSAPKLLKWTNPKITPPVTTVAKTGYFYTTDSGSWNGQSNYWRTDNNYVYQGNYDWYGFWFYGTRISTTIGSTAKTLTKMQIAITRVNSVHGVSGQADVYLMAHTLTAQPTGSPEATDSAAVKVGTLGRGETKTFTVPSGWYAGFLAGTYKGLGLHVGVTSVTDVRYLYCVGGAGGTSGRVYCEWTQ